MAVRRRLNVVFAFAIVLLFFSCADKKRQEEIDLLKVCFKKYFLLEETRSEKIAGNFDKCYFRGLASQRAIRNYNLINSLFSRTLSGIEKKGVDDEELGKLAKNCLDSMKVIIMASDSAKIQYLMPFDKKYLLRAIDSCSKAAPRQESAYNAEIKKLELLYLKNQINNGFGFYCDFVSTHCFWSPFRTDVITSNFQKEGKSFLTVDFRGGMFAVMARALCKENSEDTLVIPKENISYAKKEYDDHPSKLQLDLSFLKPGKYKMQACVYLWQPNGEVNKVPYCMPVSFEVFK